LLRNPRVLLLDEATSALDPESQRLVIDALEKARRGRTMISLSHKVEVMRQADRIFVVEHGVTVESGSYDSLLSQMGRFSEMLGGLVNDG
jgi:ATP-binding cassette subfamily B protein